ACAVLPRRHPADHLLGHALPASQPGAPRGRLPPRGQPLLPLLDLADHLDDHPRVGGHPPQAPRQVRDRGRPAQPDAQEHRQGVLAGRGAVPRGAPHARRHRAVRQGHARRLDRAPPLHPVRDPRPDPAAVRLVRPVRLRRGGGLGHWWGYRNFETTDTATNLTPWGVWIGGEELHNNHHAFPSSAKFALRRWEFDIGWVVIRALEKVKLARVLRVAPALDVRPNI